MDQYNVSTDFLEIIAGTNNTISRVYKEAVKDVDETTPKAMGYLKNFITSIEGIANKDACKDERISKTRGNITNFSGYDNIKVAMEFLEKNLGKIEIVKDLNVIYNSLKNCQPQYTEGYEKNVRLIVLEYEASLYLLITGISASMADNIGVVQNGTQIKIQKKERTQNGATAKFIHELAKQLGAKTHKEYLDELIKGKSNMGVKTNIEESVTFTESSIADTIDLIDSMISGVGRIASVGKRLVLTIKNSIFGIIPLIRSILYLRYKKKADTILALDQQVQFIKMNIEQLQNIKNMDPAKKAEIIKRQKAVAEAYTKRAEKLRAELSEGEKEAVAAIKKEDPEIKKAGDGEFVLEGGVTVEEIFSESSGKKYSKGHVNHFSGPAPNNPEKLSNIRIEKFSKKFKSNKSDASKEKGEERADADIKKLMDQVYNEFFDKTKKQSIRLVPGTKGNSDTDMSKRTDTKFGGMPYWPADEEYPKSGGDPMIMIAQLNFNKLPKLDGYPTSGLLQIFIDNFESYQTTSKDEIKIIYHESTVSADKMLADIPRSTLTEKDSSIEGVYFPTPKLEYQCMTSADEQCTKILTEIVNRVCDFNLKRWWEMPDKYYKILNDQWKSWGCRIGGHPYFTQYDVRTNSEMFDNLLLELDSEAGMMWGDCGVANIFTSSKNLRDKKFDTDVYYTWDCC